MKTILFGLLLTIPAFASDHIDGPVTTQHRVGDITDLYAFPTPKKPGSVSLVLNTYPLVGKSGHFSEKVDYTFVLRRAETAGDRFDTSDEVRITCRFKTPDNTANHSMSCASTNGLRAETRFNSEEGKKTGDDFQAYAGMRSDPFFFNLNFADKLAKKGQIAAPSDSNIMDNANVLSVVLDLDTSKLFPGKAPAMLAVVAETTTQDNPRGPVRRLDRVGRPEVTNVTMGPHGKEPDLRDQFNNEAAFAISPTNRPLYRDQMNMSIAWYDQADKVANWKPEERTKLAEILADDYLVLDMTKPCEGDNYFEIEKAMLAKKPHTSCGGRKMTDDIMDTFFTLYVRGPNGERLKDGVDKPQEVISDKFPYLAAPADSIWIQLSTFLKKKAIGISDDNEFTRGKEAAPAGENTGENSGYGEEGGESAQ